MLKLEVKRIKELKVKMSEEASGSRHRTAVEDTRYRRGGGIRVCIVCKPESV
jgi:hypothetical protein